MKTRKNGNETGRDPGDKTGTKGEQPGHFVRLFKPQFAALVEAGTKTQTVRPTPKRMPKAGDRISLRCWIGKPYRSKQRVIREAIVRAVAQFEIHYATPDQMTWCEMSLNGEVLDSVGAFAFAMADGFENIEKMAEWFRVEHGLPFQGVVIYWVNNKASQPHDTP